MDYNDLERRRGITILAEYRSRFHTPNHYRDRPAQLFRGEVELRCAWSMACCLVDASEGPLPQTRCFAGSPCRQFLRGIVLKQN